MPIVMELRATGVLTVAAPPASLVGSLATVGDPASGSLTGEVVGGAVAAWEPASTGLYSWARVKLAGAWIPEADLAGPIAITTSLDELGTRWEVSLRGAAYSPLVTESTWARVAIEVWRWHGPLDDLHGGDAAELVGVVLGASPMQSAEGGPVIRLQCGDVLAAAGERELCYELPPETNWRRGQIVADILTGLGLTSSLPAGAIYGKPLQLVSQRVDRVLEEFVEPEGWYLRRRPSDGKIEAYSADIAEHPLPVDAVWTPDDWDSIELEPPSRVASRWVIRGTSSLTIDEGGIERRLTTTIVKALYAPVVALERQDDAGVLTSSGLSPGTPTLREVARLVDEQIYRGGLLWQQITTEWGWYNPLAATLKTDDGLGPADGYDYSAVWIDEEGNGVTYPTERYLKLGERRTVHTYDAARNRIASREEVRRYGARVHAVHAYDDETLDGVGDTAWVYTDGESYDEPNERYDLQEVHETTYQFRAGGGPEIESIQESYGYAIRPIGPRPSGYVTASGLEVLDIVANWQIVERLRTSKVLAQDDNVMGEVVARSAWRPGGVFGLVEQESKAYVIESEEQFTEIQYKPGERREVTVVGGTPLPRYTRSAWTRLRSEPIEVIWEDGTVEAWFGFGRQVFDHPYVQSTAEARAVLDRRRARALCHRATVTRTETGVAEGSTVRLIDPAIGIMHRGVVVERRRTHDLATGRPLGVYVLELPL